MFGADLVKIFVWEWNKKHFFVKTGSRCKDSNKMCPVLASPKQCSDSKVGYFISQHCKRSCGTCIPCAGLKPVPDCSKGKWKTIEIGLCSFLPINHTNRSRCVLCEQTRKIFLIYDHMHVARVKFSCSGKVEKYRDWVCLFLFCLDCGDENDSCPAWANEYDYCRTIQFTISGWWSTVSWAAKYANHAVELHLRS